MVDDDLPALFRAADQASIKSQKRYLLLLRLALAFSVAGALLAAILPNAAAWRHGLAVAATACLALSLGLTLLLRMLGWERDWYACRAVAESVKSVAWRFMVGADPFPKSLPDPEAEGKLAKSMVDILANSASLAAHLGGPAGAGASVTARMRQARGLDIPERKRLYLSQRVANQREWYAGKAAANHRSYNLWFIGVLLAELAALASAAIFLTVARAEVSLAPVFAALASTVWAWLHAKRFQELAQAYGLAAHELGLSEVQSTYVAAERELAAFVSDAENAISREHTMWVARRAGA
jgi:hypothetical protein